MSGGGRMSLVRVCWNVCIHSGVLYIHQTKGNKVIVMDFVIVLLMYVFTS